MYLGASNYVVCPSTHDTGVACRTVAGASANEAVIAVRGIAYDRVAFAGYDPNATGTTCANECAVARRNVT
jgi:16S rRNA C1402 (ribose-2'-O) methylase RsmI